MATTPTAEQLYQNCLALLARREHSQAELKQKLLRKYGMQVRELIPAVLQRLTEANYQSDLRFTESFIYSRIERGFGPNRIKFELQQKGVSRDLIANALTIASIKDQEQLQIERAWRKKFNARATTTKERYQQQNHLAMRGFSQSAIENFLNSLKAHSTLPD